MTGPNESGVHDRSRRSREERNERLRPSVARLPILYVGQCIPVLDIGVDVIRITCLLNHRCRWTIGT